MTEKHTYIPYGSVDWVFPCRCWDKCPSIASILVFYFYFAVMVSVFLHTYCISSDNSPILFQFLTLNIDRYNVFLHSWNFCLCLSSVAYFSKTDARALTSVERAPFLPAQRAMRFGRMAWVRIMIINQWLYFYLINRRHPYIWVAVVSWLNYLILAVDLCGSSAQNPCSSALLHIHNAVSHGFRGFCGLKRLFILHFTFPLFISVFSPNPLLYP